MADASSSIRDGFLPTFFIKSLNVVLCMLLYSSTIFILSERVLTISFASRPSGVRTVPISTVAFGAASNSLIVV